MFELFFKYPWSAFTRGDVLFASGWPAWLLVLLVLAAAAGLAYPIWRRRSATPVRVKPVAIWLLQTGFVAMLLVLLWQPALSVATLRPQQNVVAVVVDDSASMALPDGSSGSRLDHAKQVFNDNAISELQKKFQVRLYRAGSEVERVSALDQLKAASPATRLGEAVKQITSEATSLPIGAVVLLSDGGDNAGGIDLPTLSEIRRFRIPVHTVGFGPERPERDIEVVDAQFPQRTLADSKVSGQVTLKQWGLESQKARISVKDGSKLLASREVTLRKDGLDQTEHVTFDAGSAGIRNLQVSVESVASEPNRNNNALNRLMNVDGSKPRVLYIEGEPKWEFKFIRRAVEEDQGLELVTMLRTTQNKIYRQGINSPSELEQGFPATVDELFSFQGIIIGGVEANYFTPTQQELLRQFVDRRGGGLLFLAGRDGLSDGGWGTSSLAELMPTVLPNRKDTFKRDPAYPELTSAGRDSLICRIEEDAGRNADRWKKLPFLANFQDPGTPKPGAVVLAEMSPGGRGKLPLLVTQNFGRGRSAIFATSGSWRWQMSQPLEDKSHEVFWQQMLRWLVSGSTGPVISAIPKSVFSDVPKVPLRAEVRDKNYMPVSDAQVEARMLGPGGLSETVQLEPDPANTGIYSAEWGASAQGNYVMELVARRGEVEVGRDVMSFRREDGVAEQFGTHQNRELLEKLAQQTGGRYWKPEEAGKLAQDISYSEAGISIRETRDLWDAPFFFIAALLLRGSEWLLRRKWGVV